MTSKLRWRRGGVLRRKQHALICLALMTAAPIYAFSSVGFSKVEHAASVEQETVTGKVTDSEGGQALPGVTVRVRGKEETAQTNEDGSFTISATKGDVLVFSSVGFVTREVPVTEETMAVVLVKEES